MSYLRLLIEGNEVSAQGQRDTIELNDTVMTKEENSRLLHFFEAPLKRQRHDIEIIGVQPSRYRQHHGDILRRASELMEAGPHVNFLPLFFFTVNSSANSRV
jgi:hypothetical protein